MKNKIINFKTFLSMAALAAIGTGCGKIDDFGNANDNPNAVNSPVTAALLTNAEAGLGGFAANLRTVLYPQYVSESQYTDASLYSLPQVESGGVYSGAMADLQKLINMNTDPRTAESVLGSGSNANQIAVAKIIKSYLIWSVTDRWGDVPYSEALLGQANLTPKYDKQLDIYKTIFKDLADAINGFDGGAAVRGDIIYGGSSTKWIKLANTMRMMAALRLSKKYPNVGELAQVEFAAAATHPGGIISSNADNFTVAYPGAAYQNPWYATYFTRDDYAISKTMTDCLAGLGDTRGAAFGTNGTGFPYGLTRDLAISFTNAVGGNYGRVLALNKRNENSPVVVIGASQALLTWAEGLERGWVSNGTAKAAYEAGVAASFAEWGVTMPATYLTSGPANYTSGAGVAAIGQEAAPWNAIPATQNANTPTAIKRIQLQRWLATYPNGNEGWAEFRRTGVPDLKPTRFATNAGGQIPRRYVYGVNEGSTNPAQLAIAVAGLVIPAGGAAQDAKVWWDQ